MDNPATNAWERHRLREWSIPKPDRRLGQWTPYKLVRKHYRKIKTRERVPNALVEYFAAPRMWVPGTTTNFLGPTVIITPSTIVSNTVTFVNYATGGFTTGGFIVRPEAVNAWNMWTTGPTATAWNAPSINYIPWNAWTADAYERKRRRLVPAPAPTKAELDAEAARAAERARAAKAAEEKRLLIQGRAEALLRHCLSDEQMKQYAEKRHVVVPVNGKRYVLNGNGATVIDDQDRMVEAICIHAQQFLPHGDMLLAQLLALLHSEEEFLRIGHRTLYYDRPQPWSG